MSQTLSLPTIYDANLNLVPNRYLNPNRIHKPIIVVAQASLRSAFASFIVVARSPSATSLPSALEIFADFSQSYSSLSIGQIFTKLYTEGNKKFPEKSMNNISNIFIKIFAIEKGLSSRVGPYRKLIHTIAKSLQYTILKSSSHQFTPSGFTSILLLSESHISIHSWPEENFAILEMVTCKPFSSKEEKIIVSIIKETLNTREVKITINK